MIVLSKVHLVRDDIPIIQTSLGIALVEAATISFNTIACDFLTVEKMEARALLVVVEFIDVLTTFVGLTVFLAGDSSKTGTSVNDQGLRLSVGTYENSHVEVHEVCRIPVQRSRC